MHTCTHTYIHTYTHTHTHTHIQASLREDEVCALASDHIYKDNTEMRRLMAPFAAEILLPDDAAATRGEAGGASAGGEGWGEGSVDPKWAVVRVRAGAVWEGGGVLVVFRGTHSWEDLVHDLMCVVCVMCVCIYIYIHIYI